MKRRLLTIAVLSALTAPAIAANDLQSMQMATQLGNLLASEAFCELTFNQEAIAAFVEKKVPADDMQFPSMLSLMTSGAKVQLDQMSPSGKTAQCTQVRRVAKSYGFTK